MQKTYWWRTGLVAVCLIILLGAFVGPCGYTLGKCLGGNSIIVVRTFFHFSLSLLVASPFLFFVGDTIFKKWLRFAIIWFVLATALILLVPEYQGGWLGIGLEKESVSIWMSELFVIFSIGQIAWQSRNTHRVEKTS